MGFLKMYGLTIFSLNKVPMRPIKYQDVFWNTQFLKLNVWRWPFLPWIIAYCNTWQLYDRPTYDGEMQGFLVK